MDPLELGADKEGHMFDIVEAFVLHMYHMIGLQTILYNWSQWLGPQAFPKPRGLMVQPTNERSSNPKSIIVSDPSIDNYI